MELEAPDPNTWFWSNGENTTGTFVLLKKGILATPSAIYCLGSDKQMLE